MDSTKNVFKVALFLWEQSPGSVFLLASFLFLPGYFQLPQGETGTDASLLAPRARLACGVGFMCNVQHLAVAMETGGGGVLN